ncbi:MAG: four helix bundle protein [Candidatus Kapaibacterium sp.]
MNYNQDDLREKAIRLVQSIDSFTDSLPLSEIYQLRKRLKYCISNLPPNIEKGLKDSGKLNRIRCFIKANGSLEECREYLELVEKLKYAPTDKLKEQVDEIRQLLVEEYSMKSNYDA